MTDPYDPNYWLAVLASLTLWGMFGLVVLAARSEIHSQRRARQLHRSGRQR